MRKIVWDKRTEEVVILLANGYTAEEAAKEAKVSERTVYYWKKHPDFLQELDRLSLATDVASRAERLRIAKRMIRKKLKDKMPTQKDLLDWLKYAKDESESISIAIADYTAEQANREFPLNARLGQTSIEPNRLESSEPKAIGLLGSPAEAEETT